MSVIKADLKKEGDLGLVAMVSLQLYLYVHNIAPDLWSKRTPKTARKPYLNLSGLVYPMCSRIFERLL